MMNKEIERKWLVNPTDEVINYLMKTPSVEIRDYYFNDFCRLRNIQGEWYITIKGEGTIVRDEFEFKIERSSLNFLPAPTLTQKRCPYYYKGHTFELNIFKDVAALTEIQPMNLITAEIELNSIDEEVEIPEFFDREITHDTRFYGYNLFKGLINKINQKS